MLGFPQSQKTKSHLGQSWTIHKSILILYPYPMTDPYVCMPYFHGSTWRIRQQKLSWNVSINLPYIRIRHGYWNIRTWPRFNEQISSGVIKHVAMENPKIPDPMWCFQLTAVTSHLSLKFRDFFSHPIDDAPKGNLKQVFFFCHLPRSPGWCFQGNLTSDFPFFFQGEIRGEPRVRCGPKRNHLLILTYLSLGEWDFTFQHIFGLYYK